MLTEERAIVLIAVTNSDPIVGSELSSKLFAARFKFEGRPRYYQLDFPSVLI